MARKHNSSSSQLLSNNQHRLLFYTSMLSICIFLFLDSHIQYKTCDIVEIYMIVFIGDILTFDEMEKLLFRPDIVITALRSLNCLEENS